MNNCCVSAASTTKPASINPSSRRVGRFKQTPAKITDAITAERTAAGCHPVSKA